MTHQYAGAILINEICPFCGITAEEVCESLPANLCEKAINHTFGDWLNKLNEETFNYNRTISPIRVL